MPPEKPILFLALLLTILPMASSGGGEKPPPPASIPETITDGTPSTSPAPVQRPYFVVRSSSTRKLLVTESPELAGLPPVAGEINVTVHLTEDPGLPDPPPPPSAPAPLDPVAAKRLEELRKTYLRSEFIFVSATVYDHRRTLLRVHPNGRAGSQVTAISNIDFNHFSGFSSYEVVGDDGIRRKYDLLMAVGNENTGRRGRILAGRAQTHEMSAIPELPDLAAGGPGFIVTSGDDIDAARAIRDMHTLYRVEGARMAEAFVRREAAHQERKAFLLANPPVPKDVEIHFWKRGGITGGEAAAGRTSMSPMSEPPAQPPVTFTKGLLDTWNITYEGVEGRTYFLQWSLDLNTWNYAPVIEYGSGQKNHGGSSTSPKLFLRLRYTDQATDSPYDDDFDGDRISNWFELLQGTDPLEAADEDGDQIPDDWETYFLLDPGNHLDASEDRDGDGISNLDEYLAGTDPTDFYNGDLPTVSVVSGNSQYAEPGQFTFKPLVVEVRKDGIPLVDVPVWVESVYSSPALVSLTNDGSGLVTRILAKTDANGRVAAYAKHGLEPVFNYISMATGSEVGVRIGPTLSTTTKVRMIYPSGTIGREATDTIDSLIAGKDPSTAMPVFSVQNHSGSTYVRNTQCWAYGLAQSMTGISPWNSLGGGQRAGVAITRRHVLNAAHFPLQVGTAIRFVTVDNTVVERTITGRAIHPAYQPDPPYPDFAVYTLNQDLPESITPCEMLPSDYSAWLGPLGSWQPPVLALDQEENAVVMDFKAVRKSGDGSKTWADMTKATLPPERALFHKIVTTGDSGNPAFLVLNNKLLLLTVWSTGSLGTFTTAHLSEINLMIAAADAQAGVSTGLQITSTNLSSYTPFNP